MIISTTSLLREYETKRIISSQVGELVRLNLCLKYQFFIQTYILIF